MRIRPKSDYLHTASWEQLYALGEFWQNELAFYQDEMTFFHDLIDKYFMWLMEEPNIEKVQTLIRQLRKSHEKSVELIQKVNKHQMHFEELMENAFSHDEQKFREEHAQLEDEISAFVEGARNLKKEVFSVTENVMENERLKHLLDK